MKSVSKLTASFLVPGLLLAGCAVGPDYKTPATPVPASFGEPGQYDQAAAVAGNWWSGFNDPTLERLILLASTNNYDIQLAQARLREARALWTAARFDFAPTVTSENDFQKSRTSRQVSNARNPGKWNDLYRAGFDATWELDLWGRVRRKVEAARATVESVEASRDDVLVSIRAEVAANYFELRGSQALLEVARRNATNQTETLRLAELLLQGGEGTRLDVARARSLLNSTLAAIPPIEAAISRGIHRLSVLGGKAPNDLADLAQAAPVPDVPDMLAPGNPADLLRRRPDIRAAERALAAWTARIGVEVADLFPRVTFVGSIGLEADKLANLGASGSAAGSFGPHISWAAFDLGRVYQQIRAAEARAEASLAIYQQTVLLALEETENSLVEFGRERQRLVYLREAESAASEAVELARQRYREGITDFLSVLDAERTLLTLQEQMVNSEIQTGASLIGVYKTLAGGL